MEFEKVEEKNYAEIRSEVAHKEAEAKGCIVVVPSRIRFPHCTMHAERDDPIVAADVCSSCLGNRIEHLVSRLIESREENERLEQERNEWRDRCQRLDPTGMRAFE